MPLFTLTITYNAEEIYGEKCKRKENETRWTCIYTYIQYCTDALAIYFNYNQFKDNSK